jgi:hypothetical protein
MQVAFADFVVAHWIALSTGLLAIILAVATIPYVRWVRSKWPRDMTGNGITVGHAKAFDNRSLALRVARLSAGLETLKIVNQNFVDNLSTLQEKTFTETSRSLTAKANAESKAKDKGKSKKEEAVGEGKSGPGISDDSDKTGNKPEVGLAASDMLTDQMNLASQIFNLQLLYERSLTDRLVDHQSRLQTVLGFQVSITPPVGYQNCSAIVEICVRKKTATGSLPISLVALMPQEKTYNAQSLSTSEHSIEGSAVARVVTMGFSEKGKSRQLFVHRDSDTIAFERDTESTPPLLDPNGSVFGWEFRPVLGRTTVSPGTRQMLAVIALPEPDKEVGDECILEVQTRTYWRRYHRKAQTTGPNWSGLWWKVDRSLTVNSGVQELKIPNTARIQEALAPKVTDVKWVSSGKSGATVVVRGCNFFSGTTVVMGGIVHREENGTLTLKSDQALEFGTSVESLATSDAVLSGRFGPSFQLEMPKKKRPFESLFISRAAIRAGSDPKFFRMAVDVRASDSDGDFMDLTVANLKDWPEPLLFIGSEPVAMPYDYYDDADLSTNQRSQEPMNTLQSVPGTTTTPNTKKYIRVEAWVSSKTLARSPSVSFRVPFCGSDYQSSQPLSFSEPDVVRMGGDSVSTVFRIFYPLGFGPSFTIDLDQTYIEVAPTIVRIGDTECRFTVPTAVVSQYENMVVRIGSGESYLLAIPPEDKSLVRPMLDTSAKPPQIAKGTRGPVEWTGYGFETITEVTSGGVSQPFSTYAEGSRLAVYLTDGVTSGEGKVTLECTTAAGDKLNLALFVTRA